MKYFLSMITACAVAITGFTHVQAMDEVPSEVTLIKNVNIWDGRSDGLKEGYDVLIVRNLIKKVAEDIPASGSYEVDEKSGVVKTLSVHSGIHAYSISVMDEEGKAEKKEVSGKRYRWWRSCSHSRADRYALPPSHPRRYAGWT